jgi:hypothetical protein
MGSVTVFVAFPFISPKHRGKLRRRIGTHSRPFRTAAMKRFRLSTLLLLVVIAALSLALVVQERRAARREAELQFRLVITEHIRVYPVVYQTQPMEIQMDEASLQALADQLTAVKGADRFCGSTQLESYP